jgi:alpha-2-macroglobulin
MPHCRRSGGPGWTKTATPTGASVWNWTGAATPAALDVNAVRPDATALVSYRCHAAESSRLPVTIERKLYRLVPIASTGDKDKAKEPGRFTFSAKAVKPGDAIDSNALYVDEVTLTPKKDSAFHYGLLDVQLPPGGSVEATSWGVSIGGLPGPGEGGSGAQPFQRAATYEMGEMAYHQPVPLLDRPVALRQLVRFALPSTFVVLPARYFRMYQPDAKAFEGGKSDRLIKMKIE